jgi:hypothetical protein
MTAPSGYDGVVALCGDPLPLLDDDGHISTLWESKMVKVAFPTPLVLGWTVLEAEPKFAKTARVHRAISAELERVVLILEREDLWEKLRTFDGAYTWRMTRGSATKLSTHSFGLALDFDAATNQLGNANGDINRGIVQVFESCGWTWGGRFRRPDPMHFQFAKGV